MTRQSTLASITAAIADHCVLFKSALVGLVVLAVWMYEPEGVRRAIDYAASDGSSTNQVVSRVARRVDDPAAISGSSDALLWFLEKGNETLRAETRERGNAGVDLLIFKNGQLWQRERWPDRTGARAAASLKRARLQKLGWVRPHRSH